MSNCRDCIHSKICADWEAYDKAIRKYESVLWTHMADMYASKVIGV